MNTLCTPAQGYATATVVSCRLLTKVNLVNREVGLTHVQFVASVVAEGQLAV
jgi:hypothetical protein